MKWTSGISGYVEISLWGMQPERVINMALSRGISIWDIRHQEKDHYILKVSLGGYKALRILVRRSSCRVKIITKKGAPFLVMRAKRRKVLVIGTFFFCLTLYFLSSFVWFIEVTGNKLVSAELILEKGQLQGLRRGMPKAAFNRKELAERLLSEIPELSWAGIHTQGTKVIIEVAEKTLPPADDEHQPADLVARIDGKIEELLVLVGTPLVREGDQVKKGQTLIAGLLYSQIKISETGEISPEGEPELVRAKGLIRGRVVRTHIEQCPILEEIRGDTGAETGAVLLKLLGKEIYLRGTGECAYENYRVIRQTKPLINFKGRIFQGAVELITIVFKEQFCERRQWGIEGAYQEAGRRAREILKSALPIDCKITAQKFEPVPVQDKGIVAVKYELETVEDIGTYRRR